MHSRRMQGKNTYIWLLFYMDTTLASLSIKNSYVKRIQVAKKESKEKLELSAELKLMWQLQGGYHISEHWIWNETPPLSLSYACQQVVEPRSRASTHPLPAPAPIPRKSGNAGPQWCSASSGREGMRVTYRTLLPRVPSLFSPLYFTLKSSRCARSGFH